MGVEVGNGFSRQKFLIALLARVTTSSLYITKSSGLGLYVPSDAVTYAEEFSRRAILGGGIFSKLDISETREGMSESFVAREWTWEAESSGVIAGSASASLDEDISIDGVSGKSWKGGTWYDPSEASEV